MRQAGMRKEGRWSDGGKKVRERGSENWETDN